MTNKLKCLFYLLCGVIITQCAPVGRESFDFNIFNSSEFQNDFSKHFQPPPTIDPKLFEHLNDIHEDVFQPPQDRHVVDHSRPFVPMWFFMRILIGVFFVAILGCIICFRKCCKRRTVGILHRESILVVVTPGRSRAEEPVADPAATPPPSYDEAVVIPPLPTAEELKAKRQAQANQSEA